jgi:hypothetical protein
MNALQVELNQPEYTGLTDAEAVARLLETVDLPPDTTAYTWSGTNERLGELGVVPQVRAVWDTVITQFPGGTMLDRMLSSGGVNYAREDVRQQLQATIDGLDLTDQQQAIAAVVLEALLRIGQPVAPRWQKVGLGAEPTGQQVAEARAANLRAELLANWQVRFDAAINQYGTSEQADGVAAVEAIAAEMAGD